jgi:hydrogen cyanide synthase HcnB
MKAPPKDSEHIAIIGAGPAGMSAAIQISKVGIRSTIIDENSAFGGAIYRQPTGQSSKSSQPNGKFEKLKNDIDRYRNYFDFKFNAEVVGTFESERELAVLKDGKLSSLEVDRLIVTTGCFERAQPFPGWTLPGVMTVGGAQLQIKSGLVKPGQSIVLAGTGPLLLVAAVQFHKAGVNVKGVFESGRRVDLFKELPLLLSKFSLLADGLRYLLYLKREKVPVRFGWGIVEAKGDKAVSNAKVAPFDRNWNPVLNKAKVIKTDCLGVEYGFVSRSELTQLIGCNHDFSKTSGGVIPIVDEWQRTSKNGVYVAGDSAGVFGADSAQEQGLIAALGCLIDCKVIVEPEAEKLAKASRKKIQKLAEFRQGFERFSELRPGLLKLPDADTTICRCENVSMNQVCTAIDQGVSDMVTLKMTTRVGMGDCQGKMCGSFCQELLKQKTSRSIQEIGHLKPRFPLTPVPFSALVKKEDAG